MAVSPSVRKMRGNPNGIMTLFLNACRIELVDLSCSGIARQKRLKLSIKIARYLSLRALVPMPERRSRGQISRL